MKKFFFLVAAAMISFAANAHTVNNPIGTDGRYIVKYDCEAGQFAASNDMEVDETFVMAFDLTGTWMVDYLLGTPIVEGAQRGIAFNFWTSCGDTDLDVRRLKQIDGNIWGMTLNINMAKNATADFSKALMPDSVMYVYGQLFGFEWTEDKMGALWWQGLDGGFDGANTVADGADCVFTFAPYTGTKTSTVEFYGDEFAGGMYNYSIMGYAAPCVDITAGVEDVEAVKTTEKIMVNGQLILIHNGVQYTVLGAQK